MHPIIFSIGGFSVYIYGLFVFFGVMAAYFFSRSAALRRDVDPLVFDSIFFWAVFYGFLGARALFVAVEWQYFILHIREAFFSRSGFVLFGGLLAGLPALWFLAIRKGVKPLLIFDALAVGAPLGHALGRVGCFFQGCCYGRQSDAWFAVRFPLESEAGTLGYKLIPVQLFESLFLLCLFIFLFWLDRSPVSGRKQAPGKIAVIYLFSYAVFRFIIEFFRGDPRGGFAGLATSQWISIGVVIGSAFLFRLVLKPKK
jgi:phosphatidylglycerol---prolipoprotein diacylglyceryl transferase